jgi:Lon protease-like protein
METIPLFPLSAVLLPGARMPLQIFEPRYMDLVSDCMKQQTGFGVVLLREGNEVLDVREGSAGQQPETRLSPLGTYARIVDWDSLPNGKLGITIEGERKFRLLGSRVEASRLHLGEVEWLAPEPYEPLPEGALELKGLLRQLTEHPHVAALNISPDIEDTGTLGCVLTQLLPIDEAIKFQLLALGEPLLRLEQIMKLLDDMAQ